MLARITLASGMGGESDSPDPRQPTIGMRLSRKMVYPRVPAFVQKRLPKHRTPPSASARIDVVKVDSASIGDVGAPAYVEAWAPARFNL